MEFIIRFEALKASECNEVFWDDTIHTQLTEGLYRIITQKATVLRVPYSVIFQSCSTEDLNIFLQNILFQ
jgi:hypothetical protein